MMVTLLLVLLPVAGLVIGYSLGASTATRRAEDAGLDKNEKRELESYRSQDMELVEKASEAATLGDDFGVTVLGILSKNRSNRQIGNKK